MKLSFDKALLWFIPYLYLVAICYYWGYWGTLQVDAFNYYDISDLIKGVIIPIYSVLLTVILVLPLTIYNEYVAQFLSAKKKFILIILCYIGFYLLYLVMLYLLGFVKVDLQPTKNHHGTVPFIFFTTAGISYALALLGARYKPEGEQLDAIQEFYRFGVLFVILLIPSNAFAMGRTKAHFILENRSFEYVLTEGLASPQKTLYKYVGKVGGFHVLITEDNNKHIIIAADKLSPLVTESFNDEDSVSALRLAFNRKALKQLPLKPFEELHKVSQDSLNRVKASRL